MLESDHILFAEDGSPPLLRELDIAQFADGFHRPHWFSTDSTQDYHGDTVYSLKLALNTRPEERLCTAPSSSASPTFLHNLSGQHIDRRHRTRSSDCGTYRSRKALRNVAPNQGLHRGVSNCYGWSERFENCTRDDIDVPKAQYCTLGDDDSWSGGGEAKGFGLQSFCDESATYSKGDAVALHQVLPSNYHDVGQSLEGRKNDAALDDLFFHFPAKQQLSPPASKALVHGIHRMNDWHSGWDSQSNHMWLPPTPTSLPSPVAVAEEPSIYPALHDGGADVAAEGITQNGLKQKQPFDLAKPSLIASQADDLQRLSWQNMDYEGLYNSFDGTAHQLCNPFAGQWDRSETEQAAFEETFGARWPAISPGSERILTDPSTEISFAGLTNVGELDINMPPWDPFTLQAGLEYEDPAVFESGPDTAPGTKPVDEDIGLERMPRECATARSTQRDCERDEFLIRCKTEGMSYKDIKIKGGFEEAESTLRGRFRTLTKPKEQRVRKPEWQEQDIRLLLEAVDHFSRPHFGSQRYVMKRPLSNLHRKGSKTPWKQVAEYMALRGSYKFGNSTVKKKYLEILGRHSAW